MRANSDAVLKIAFTTLFLLLGVAVILITRSPAKGYELSIYSPLSPLTWALLITSIVGGIGIIVYQISRDKQEENWWQIGLLLILLGNLVIVLLPYLRGYAFPCCGDKLSHVGMVKDILNSGKFASSNVYPVTHILIACFSFILNTCPEVMTNFAGPLFYLLFVLFTYCLSRELLPKSAAILATTASTVLFCYYYNQVFPMGFAFITFPLVFYLYFKHLKGESVSLAILLVVLIVLMVFFHPVASFVLTVALLVMELGKSPLARLYDGKKRLVRSSSPWVSQISLNLPLISFIILMLWLWQNFSVWNNAVTNVASWFRLELLVKPMTEVALESFNKLGLGPLGQLELFIKVYGHYFIYLLLAAITIIMLVRRRLNLSPTNQRSAALYSSFFLLATAVWLIDYVRPLTSLSSGRIIHLMPALFPPLVGMALYQIGEMRYNGAEALLKSPLRFYRGKVWRTIVIGLIIAVCSLIGIFGFYPSPYRYQPYWGVSHAEEVGEYWLLQHGDPTTKVVSLGTAPCYRYAHALWGTQEINYPHEDRNEHVPDHFNYAQYSTLGESFEGDRYMSTREEFVEMVYTKLYPQIGRFNGDDFAKLNRDSSSHKLYNNGEMQVWYVHCQAVAE